MDAVFQTFIYLWYKGQSFRFFRGLVGVVDETCGGFKTFCVACKGSTQALHCASSDN